MITAATVSALRLSRLASGGGGRSEGVTSTSVDAERVRWGTGLLFDPHALDQDLPLLPVDARHEDGAIEEPIRDVGVAAHDCVVDEHLAAVGLEDEEHRRLGVPGLPRELPIDPRSVVEHLR